MRSTVADMVVEGSALPLPGRGSSNELVADPAPIELEVMVVIVVSYDDRLMSSKLRGGRRQALCHEFASAQGRVPAWVERKCAFARVVPSMQVSVSQCKFCHRAPAPSDIAPPSAARTSSGGEKPQETAWKAKHPGLERG